MGIFLWDTAPSKIFVWDTQVSKVFVWDTKVRPNNVYVDFLLIGWWGWGWRSWGWGWAWWFIECCNYALAQWEYSVKIWGGGRWCRNTSWCNGGNSCFDWIIAYWWGWWARNDYYDWCPWWSGWWGSDDSCWWAWCTWQGNSWWDGWHYSYWGWGWAWWAWCNGSANCHGWTGGLGKCSCISWECCRYAWWWGGGNRGGYCSCNSSCGWGWCWWNWTWTEANATACWAWGWWHNASCNNGHWACWLFILRYPTACWYNITGWSSCCYTCYVCGDYTIHCFTYTPNTQTLTVS